ncbi:hypothetical protein SAMN05428966_11783 [Massilia sp. PDC64]|nr:hypothetical protein [Massilia sp. PDC64]SDF58436.1 hypothetical protein SAMN05428966_11783 [Massilia sp. PDC64]
MNNVARGILTVILSLALAGFGLCGAFGTIGGLAGLSDSSAEGRGIGQLMLICGLAGLAIAGVCLYVVVRLRRKRPRAGE